ncbi:MAG: ATP synthase F1 subunit delta [Flavobacteriaceae bacterium]|nr:ATP synthase F1 subunit delta [Flavobacteriaceae bacterium]
MKNSRVAIRYARSLFALAQERNSLEQVFKAFEQVSETFKSNKELRQFINNPIIKNADKKAALTKIFKFENQEIAQLLSLLLHNGRIGIFGAVAQQFTNLYRDFHNVQAAQLTSAQPLDEQQVNAIMAVAKSMSDKTIEITQSINPELIGGFVLRIGDMQYNASVSDQLMKVKKQLLSAHVANN